MILYHGTCTKFIEQIERDGILPRKTHGNSVYADIQYESRPDFVYLTDRYPMFYAEFAQKLDARCKAAIVQVDVPESKLFPDEEFIGTVLAKKHGMDNEDEKKLILSINPANYRQHWKVSLDYMGTVACRVVKPAQVKGIYVVDKKDFDLMFAIGLDTNPQAGARHALLQSVLDGVPGRLPFPEALRILFAEGRDAVIAARDEKRKEMEQLFKKTGGK